PPIPTRKREPPRREEKKPPRTPSAPININKTNTWRSWRVGGRISDLGAVAVQYSIETYACGTQTRPPSGKPTSSCPPCALVTVAGYRPPSDHCTITRVPTLIAPTAPSKNEFIALPKELSALPICAPTAWGEL